MRTWLCLAVALAACGGKSDEPAPPPPGNAAPAKVELYVNDAVVATLDAAQVSGWPRLDTLLPVSARRIGTWDAVYIKGKTDKPSEISRPGDTYRELVAALFPGEGGAPAFGMFDPVELGKKGKPALREDYVREIRIKVAQNTGRGEHESGEGGGNDPTKLVLTIKTATGDTVIKGDKLLAMPREPQPGEDGDPKGWTLKAILDAAGVKSFERLMLTDAAGLNITLDKADVTDSSVPFIKLNRQGSLRFRVFKKQGSGWQPTGDLRALTTIQVVK
jgi:hypothetical protein